MHRKLCIGNPLSIDNFFYRKCKAGDAPDPAGVARLYRKVIHISGDDSPNVVAGRRWAEGTDPHKPPRPSSPIPGLLSYDEYIRRQQEWDETQQKMRLFGMFYEGGEAFMYPAAWLMDSERLHKQLLESEIERKVQALGIDVAAGGASRAPAS